MLHAGVGPEWPLIQRYESLAWTLPVGLGVALLLFQRPRRIGYSLVVGAVVGHQFCCVWANMGVFPDPHPFYSGPADVTVTMGFARPWNYNGVLPPRGTEGWTRYAPDALNGRGSRDLFYHFTYVAADMPSTGPLNPSVNATPDYWGMALRSVRGRCNLLVARYSQSPSQPYRPIVETYGVLPDGEPCVGSAATPANAVSTDWETIRR